jgi:hypothetical protein
MTHGVHTPDVVLTHLPENTGGLLIIFAMQNKKHYTFA